MRMYPLPPVEKLPEVESKEKEHMAWLEGWASGIGIGGVLGAAGMYILLSVIGKVQ